jgi:GAF domain-containing protein
VQYLDGGPCVRAVELGSPLPFHPHDVLNEDTWRLFGAATAAAGVASTLSLPILLGQEVVAGVNLYAATPDAFDDHLDTLATICGASAAGAVTNADLTFATRQAATRAADQIREENAVSLAIGMLISADLLTPEEANAKLRQAAQRAGISETQAARFITEVMNERHGSE